MQTQAEQIAETTAKCWPQGTCPKPWVACVGGDALFDARGGLRRFSTEKAAMRAAIQSATRAV